MTITNRTGQRFGVKTVIQFVVLPRWARASSQLVPKRRQWEISHMITLVKADDKGRIPIRGTQKGRQYLVTKANGGWWVTPARAVRLPKRRRRWAGPKK